MNKKPLPYLEKAASLPSVSRLQALAAAKGGSYLVAWAHRISGILLLVYVLLHINTLSGLSDPESFSRKMEMFNSPATLFFEWLLAVPVIFHCLNGGRLLVYELFSTGFDKRMRSWVYGLSCIYLALLGYLMILADESVSPHFFWLCVIIFALVVSYPVTKKIMHSKLSVYWKWQRITAAFLFLLVPAHMLFMHLNHRVGRDPQVIAERLNQPLIIFLDSMLLFFLLYHGGYGLIGIIKDYVEDRAKLKLAAAGVLVVLLAFGLQGIALIGSV